MDIEVGGLFGFILLILDLWAIISTINSKASTGAKVVWIVLIVLLPLIGYIIWLLFGPRPSR
jgi:hypothetical protein